MTDFSTLIAALNTLKPDELQTLVDDFSADMGVKAVEVMPLVNIVAPAKPAAQTEFSVQLTNFGSKKIDVIKIVRDLTGLGLKEAKELVERAPTYIKEGVSADVGEEIKRKLEAVGAKVDLV